MALPAAIQAQVEQADAYLAAMNAQPEEGTQQTQTAPASEAQRQAEPPVPAPVPQPSDEPWEHKFKSLQGIFNKEVPALQGQVKELTARLEQAVAQIEAKKAAPPEPVAHKPEADPKDVEAFGTDLVEMAHRAAQSVLGSVVQKVDSEFAKLVARLSEVEKQLDGTAKTVAVTAEDQFFQRLAAAVPEWEKINSSQVFIDWLQETDPVYGLPRQAALSSARSNLDSARAVSIFQAFAGTKPPAPVTQSSVDRQVSPKTSATGTPQPQAQKPMVPQSYIVKFYDDKRRGAYRGNEAEAARLEAEIDAAIAEGRVR